ncbi:hypothetical protein CPC08DRAFT_712486 [Agrocybe pediades]|nr:hypothetical protein CPC08DRAFT_712486 [Agrocybe pediades]
MPLSRNIYNQLSQHPEGDDESSEKLLGGGERSVTIEAQAPTSKKERLSFWAPHIALFSLYSIFHIALYVLFIGDQSKKLKQDCLRQTSLYSPAHEAVEYSIVRFNASLDFPSPYSGKPRPELEEAWDRISTKNTLWPIRVSDDTLEQIHKFGRKSNVRYMESDGGGSMGTVEVFHQLHCLNLLRKYTYLDEYPQVKKMFAKRPKFMRSHLDHCIEIMRQNLMCNADVGIISYDWIAGYELPFPDFNTYHKCRNFDNILEWASEHRVHLPPSHIRRLGNEVDLLEEPK